MSFRELKLVGEKQGFATNSSSYHQVVYRQYQPIEIEKDNYSPTLPVHLRTDDYGWGYYGACLTTWQEKACYVLTWYCNKIDYDVRAGQKLDEMKELRGFKAMIEKHVGKGCVVIDGEVGIPDEYGADNDWRGSIDHQSCDLLDGRTPETLETLIFSNSLIYIENDNDDTTNKRQWTEDDSQPCCTSA